MRFLIVSKPSGSGAGESQAARYVARRKEEDGRKAEAPTKLFNAQAENFGDKRANLWLGDGHAPVTRDVQHLILSFAHEEDFLALGEDETARQQALRELTRAMMAEVTERLDTPELRWVGGIHRNTDNPHVHLLLQRNYVDRAGRSQRLGTRLAEWQVQYEKNGHGERIVQPSPMSQTFARLWEERRAQRADRSTPSELTKSPSERATDSRSDREILGRSLLLQAGWESLQQARDDQLRFGSYWRYPVISDEGKREQLSLHEFEQRAKRHVQQIISALPFGLAAPERQALQERLREKWFVERADTLAQLNTAQEQEAEKLAARIVKFEQQAEPILTAAQAIQEKYEKEEQATLLPALSPAALTWLQERVIHQGDAQRLTSLEEIRLQLADEKNAVPRTGQELARFVAQKIVAEARLQTERQKAAKFETNQHLYRWEIAVDPSSENAPQKNSLASVERALRYESDQAKFIGARAVHWNDERRAQAQQRVADLMEQRALIRQKIAERQIEFANRIERQASVVNALNTIAERESGQRKLAGQSLPAPQFNAPEMRELESLAQRRGDPEFTRTLLQWERNYDAQAFTRNESPLVERTSRAFARVILAEITQHEVTRQQRNFVEKREHVAVLLIESGEREPTTARLVDVAPRSRLERAFPAISANRVAYQAVAIALSVQEQRLADERQRAVQNRTRLTEAAHIYAKEFQQAFPTQPLPRPAFRPQEIERLASHLEKETDPSLREHYEAIYQAAVHAEGRVPEHNQRGREGEIASMQTIEWER